MSETPRRPYHHGDLRAALLRAALELLDEHGPDGVALREVARRAGVSHAAPANHFADRRGLLTTLAADLFEGLAGGIETALDGEATGKSRSHGRARGTRVQAFADAVMDFGLARPQRYRLLWRRDLLDDADPRLRGARDRIYDRLVAELAEDGTEGTGRRLRPHDVHTEAHALWSLVHGYVLLRLDGVFERREDTISGEPRERAVVGLLLRAMD